MTKFGLLGALCIFAVQAPANATEVVYSTTVDLTDSNAVTINADGVQIFLPGFDGPGNSIALNPGDTLTGTVSFGGERLEISDSGHGDSEILTFYPFISTDLSDTFSSGTFSFLGLAGDYVGPFSIAGNISGAVLGGYRVGDLTPTSFSFSGIAFTLDYQGGTATSFDPYVVAQFSRVDGAILPGVPEPSTWGLMLLGFGAIGYSLRRRRMKIAIQV